MTKQVRLSKLTFARSALPPIVQTLSARDPEHGRQQGIGGSTSSALLPLRKNVSARGWALTRSLLLHPCLHGSEDDSAACGGIADINGQLSSLKVAITIAIKQSQLAFLRRPFVDGPNPNSSMMRLAWRAVAPRGYTIDRAIVRQRKTGRSVKFELTEQTRESVDSYLRRSALQLGEYLFPGRGAPDKHLTTRQYARLLGEWLDAVGLDPSIYGTHSLRRRHCHVNRI